MDLRPEDRHQGSTKGVPISSPTSWPPVSYLFVSFRSHSILSLTIVILQSPQAQSLKPPLALVLNLRPRNNILTIHNRPASYLLTQGIKYEEVLDASRIVFSTSSDLTLPTIRTQRLPLFLPYATLFLLSTHILRCISHCHTS